MTGSSPSARFTDGKEPGALRTIGEVADALGIRQHVLRYWEQQFPMLRPLKRSGGRRYYRPEDVVLVERIDRLVNREGYTLRGARQALEADTAGAPAAISPVTPPKIAGADLLPQLRAIRSRLAQALQA
jgi:DNA-binding transcriptional MerR regulator